MCVRKLVPKTFIYYFKQFYKVNNNLASHIKPYKAYLCSLQVIYQSHKPPPRIYKISHKLDFLRN